MRKSFALALAVGAFSLYWNRDLLGGHEPEWPRSAGRTGHHMRELNRDELDAGKFCERWGLAVQPQRAFGHGLCGQPRNRIIGKRE